MAALSVPGPTYTLCLVSAAAGGQLGEAGPNSEAPCLA